LLLRSTEIRPHRPNDLLPPSNSQTPGWLPFHNQHLAKKTPPPGLTTRGKHRDTPRQRHSRRGRTPKRSNSRVTPPHSTLGQKNHHPRDSPHGAASRHAAAEGLAAAQGPQTLKLAPGQGHSQSIPISEFPPAAH